MELGVEKVILLCAGFKLCSPQAIKMVSSPSYAFFMS